MTTLFGDDTILNNVWVQGKVARHLDEVREILERREPLDDGQHWTIEMVAGHLMAIGLSHALRDPQGIWWAPL